MSRPRAAGGEPQRPRGGPERARDAGRVIVTRRGVAFLIVVLGCVFPACSEALSGQEPGMMPEASTAPPRDAAAQDPQGGKPLPPLEVAIALERADLTVGE